MSDLTRYRFDLSVFDDDELHMRKPESPDLGQAAFYKSELERIGTLVPDSTLQDIANAWVDYQQTPNAWGRLADLLDALTQEDTA